MIGLAVAKVPDFKLIQLYRSSERSVVWTSISSYVAFSKLGPRYEIKGDIVTLVCIIYRLLAAVTPTLHTDEMSIKFAKSQHI